MGRSLLSRSFFAAIEVVRSSMRSLEIPRLNPFPPPQPYTLGVAGNSMASRPDLQQSLNATRADRSFFGHPRGLATLFFTEMWERFSYYGMRALLILFMTAGVASGGLGFSYAKAGAIYGLYTGMVYLLSLPGGWVADRITGQRRAVLYGGILISAGQFCLVAPSITTFYLGLRSEERRVGEEGR